MNASEILELKETAIKNIPPYLYCLYNSQEQKKNYGDRNQKVVGYLCGWME